MAESVKEVKEYKLFIKVTKETYERFAAWADRLGLTKSQFGSMCVQSGMSSIIRAVSPEEAFTPEQLVAIIKAAGKSGVQLDFNDFMPGEKGGADV